MGVCCEDGCQNDATWAWKTVKKTGQTHRVKNRHAECHDCWKRKDSAAAAKRRRIKREARGALPADELPADGELALASPSVEAMSANAHSTDEVEVPYPHPLPATPITEGHHQVVSSLDSVETTRWVEDEREEEWSEDDQEGEWGEGDQEGEWDEGDKEGEWGEVDREGEGGGGEGEGEVHISHLHKRAGRVGFAQTER